MKVIDFDIIGNDIEFILGLDECNDYYGDDWDDRPYEHNAGRVYDEFIAGSFIFTLPKGFAVKEACKGYLNSPYSKIDFRDEKFPFATIQCIESGAEVELFLNTPLKSLDRLANELYNYNKDI